MILTYLTREGYGSFSPTYSPPLCHLTLLMNTLCLYLKTRFSHVFIIPWEQPYTIFQDKKSITEYYDLYLSKENTATPKLQLVPRGLASKLKKNVYIFL